MKQLPVLALLLAAVMTSCSKSDDTAAPVLPATEYFPLVKSNYWVYKVTGTDFDAGKDSLYVANDTVIAGNTYQKLKTKKAAIGFYSASASRNSARKTGDKIVITGSAGLNIAAALPIEIALSDFVVFKESAEDGELLDSRTGSFDQVFNGITLTVTYTLKTIALSKMAAFTAPDQKNYTNVRPVNTIISLAITTPFGGVPIPVLKQQNVVTSKQYYAKDIGVVYTKTIVGYHLEDLASTVNIPQDYAQTSEEILDTYSVD